jgi:glycosyltransferase involved in cell wall biosynthesis
MRICHVIESASGGSAAILAMLALHAVRRGHETHVVYSPDRADERLVESLKAGGTIVTSVPMRRSVGPHDVRDGLRLRQALRSLGPLDVLHSHSSKAGALVRTAGRFSGTAQIYSPHGFYTMTGQAPFYVGPVERALALLTDRIIAVSNYERRHALELGIAENKVSIVVNGVAPFEPLARDEARRELGLDTSAFVVGFVGRLAEQKDPVAAVETALALPGDIRAQLVIIGDGDLRAAAQARASGSGHRVVFAGGRNAKRLMSAFDCLLCTSNYEGMPVSFLEALNCGVPIVSFPVGGTEELVQENVTGFITAPQPTAAAKAIEQVARLSAPERRRLEQSCRDLAAHYSDAAMGDATIALYREVLDRR